MARRIPKDPDARWEWIKYQLRSRKLTLTTLADEHGRRSRQAVQLTKYNHSPKWEGIIAAKIGRTPQEIWPERYAA